MYIGLRFREIFSKARESDTYWLEDVRLDLIDMLQTELKRRGITLEDFFCRLRYSQGRIWRILNGPVTRSEVGDLMDLIRSLDDIYPPGMP